MTLLVDGRPVVDETPEDAAGLVAGTVAPGRELVFLVHDAPQLADTPGAVADFRAQYGPFGFFCVQSSDPRLRVRVYGFADPAGAARFRADNQEWLVEPSVRHLGVPS